MASILAAQLDELMGRDRNLPPDAKVKKTHWDDDIVCKYYLVDFCPYEVFTNTKFDMGVCEKIHDEPLKKKYKESSRYMKMGYEQDFLRFLENALAEVDRKIKRGHARLAVNDSQNNVKIQQLTRENEAKIAVIQGEIDVLLVKVEALGTEGKVDEASETIKEVERLTFERDKIKIETDTARAMERHMRVCEICGSFLIINDAPSRVEDHNTGKQHTGFLKVRQAVITTKELLYGKEAVAAEVAIATATLAAAANTAAVNAAAAAALNKFPATLNPIHPLAAQQGALAPPGFFVPQSSQGSNTIAPVTIIGGSNRSSGTKLESLSNTQAAKKAIKSENYYNNNENDEIDYDRKRHGSNRDEYKRTNSNSSLHKHHHKHSSREDKYGTERDSKTRNRDRDRESYKNSSSTTRKYGKNEQFDDNENEGEELRVMGHKHDDVDDGYGPKSRDKSSRHHQHYKNSSSKDNFYYNDNLLEHEDDITVAADQKNGRGSDYNQYYKEKQHHGKTTNKRYYDEDVVQIDEFTKSSHSGNKSHKHSKRRSDIHREEYPSDDNEERSKKKFKSSTTSSSRHHYLSNASSTDYSSKSRNNPTKHEPSSSRTPSPTLLGNVR